MEILNNTVLRKPKVMHMVLTDMCNLSCPICRESKLPYWFKPGMDKTNLRLATPVVESIVESCFDDLEQLRLDSGGELLLSKELPYVLDEATKRDLPIFISSNGMLLTPAHAQMLVNSSLNEMQISLDSPDAETLALIRRGANLDGVIQGARNLVEARNSVPGKQLDIAFHAALFKQNLRQFPDLIRLAAELGLDTVSYMYGHVPEFLDPDWSIYWERHLVNDVILEARKVADEHGIFLNGPPLFPGKIRQLNPAPKICNYLTDWTYIDSNARVAPCCIASDHHFGSLKTESFHDIWNGEKYNSLRGNYNSVEPDNGKCSKCYIIGDWNPDDYRCHFAKKHWDYCEDVLKGQEKKRYDICRYGNYEFSGEFTDELEELCNLQSRSNWPAVLSMLDALENKYPDTPEFQFIRVDVLIMSGGFDETLILVDHLINRNPDEINLSNQKIRCLILMKKYREALLCLEASLKIDSNNLETRKLLQELMLIIRERKASAESLRRIRVG